VRGVFARSAMVGACLVSVAAVASVPAASAKPSKARVAQLRASWDRSPTVNARVESLLRQMTLEEKADLATGVQNDFYGFYDNGIPRLGIPPLQMADGPIGVRTANPNVFEQKTTALPSGLALASTWDTDLASRYGDVMGD
jgi:beta-glucosidase